MVIIVILEFNDKKTGSVLLMLLVAQATVMGVTLLIIDSLVAQDSEPVPIV